jgi:hypothetical protein
MRVPEFLAGQLDLLVGARNFSISFYKRPQDGIGCEGCLDLSLRDSRGELVALSHLTQSYGSFPGEGDAFDMTGPAWLDPSTDAYRDFSLPFASVGLRNTGCDTREAIRPGSLEETPLAVEFVAEDEVVVAVYDRNVEHDVSVGGESFDIWVSDAFFRGPLNCGDCPVTVGSFFLLRADVAD